MYVRPVRRKKINLWLLILIILFIVAIVFTIIHMSNSSKANSDSRYSEKTNNNTINKELQGSTIGKVDSYDSFSNITVVPNESGTVEMYNEIPTESVTPTPVAEPEPVKLNDHTYSFKELGEFSLQGSEPAQYVELKKGDILYRLNTEKTTFNDMLNKEGLQAYLETTYNIKVTSELKTGTINDIQMIICSMADGSSVGYFIITPLNDSEVLCMKVFDANNQLALIKDLSEPIKDIDSIKTNIQ
ncbi:MAG: hypothetical protein IKE91_02120 [Clostridia bacterium]|nr:hypothetical protein [Clostridia bacterium]